MQTEGRSRKQRGARRAGLGGWLGTALRAFEILLWMAFFASALTVLGVRYWLLPDIERYREDIVAAISQSIGLPVKIGAIEAGWLGLRPRLALADVRIYDREGREALVLPAVENVLSWRSLVFQDLRLHSVAIDSPRLAIRRARDGALFVAGMRVDPSDGRLADWVLGQREIVVRNAEIEWLDEQRGAPVLGLSALNFRLHNNGDEHAFGISARPPAQLGSGIDFRGELIGESIMDPARWSGRVFAELGYTDLAGWRPWIDYPLELHGGHGALRVWATLDQGSARRATVDLALTRAAARLAEELPVLELASVRGRVQARSIERGYEFSGRDLELALPGGARVLPARFALAWEPGTQSDFLRASLTASRIDLQPLAGLVEYLPAPAEIRAFLRDTQPQGSLLDVNFDWSGTLPPTLRRTPEGAASSEAGARASAAANLRSIGSTRFSLRARFAGFGMKASGNLPGVSALAGTIDANSTRGSLRLASSKLELDLAQWLPQSQLALETLTGRIDWQRPPAGPLSVKVSQLSFSNDHLAGHASGTYTRAGDGPGVLDMNAALTRADGRFTAKYLPLAAIMGEKSRDWVASSVVAGRASEVRLRLKGELRDFPFDDPAKGTFLVTARVANGVLDPSKGWPRIEGIEGTLRFERNRFDFDGRSASILGARLSNVKVSVPSLSAAQVSITGNAEGPSSEFLRYIALSPARRMIDGATDALSMSGSGRLQMRIDLLLDDMANSRVSGEYQFANNAIIAEPQLPPVERATGKVSFNDAGLVISDVRGQFLGGPVSVSGGTKPGAGLSIVARGDVQVQNLRPLFDHPWRRSLSGSASYVATVLVNPERTQVTVESPLRGVASSLPAPLAKRAEEILPLRVDVLSSESGTRDRISVALGRTVAAEFLRRKQGEAMALQRAAVALNPPAGQALRVPERPGTLLYGALPALDLDRWRPFFAGGDTGSATYELAIGTLDLYGRRVHAVDLRAGSDAGGWSARVKATELAGELAYRSENGGRLIARLAHFRMPEPYPGAPETDGVKDLPAVDLMAERFTLRGKQFGRVEIAAQRQGADWRIDKLATVNPESSLSGKGIWRAGAQARTSISFELQASDAGRFLERLGYAGLLKGGSAKLNGTLAWNGDPLTIDYPSMQGDLGLEASDGQFLEIEPGIGKLVSLMSLQMLPRRIALDFRDVFSKGFQFDRITSSMHIERGVLKTSDFKMRGPAAEVEMSGETSLARETQNLRVRVVPSLGDTASTVVGVIGGPIAGVATMIAQRVLKNPLGQIFSYEYSVTGTWSDPKVEKVSGGGTPPGSAASGGDASGIPSEAPRPPPAAKPGG